MGAHFPGTYEYRVIEWNADKREWSTVIYTEYLDKALDCYEPRHAGGRVVRLGRADWAEVRRP